MRQNGVWRTFGGLTTNPSNSLPSTKDKEKMLEKEGNNGLWKAFLANIGVRLSHNEECKPTLSPSIKKGLNGLPGEGAPKRGLAHLCPFNGSTPSI